MPYRRLPNTDAARLKALRAAFAKGKELPPFKLAYSQVTLNKIHSFLPAFEKAIFESKQAYSNQTQKSKDYLKINKKARLYISHFIQVVNMAIYRGDLPASDRKLFGMTEYENKLPNLNSEHDIIKWGEKLILGESLRASKGLSPVTNPTVALVKVRYEKFLEAYKFQKMLQKNFTRAQEHLINLRKQADELIVSIWNEVEESFKNLSPVQKREKSKLYGLVYVYRKNEIKELKNENLSI
ncbi:MAG: hypothetical protein JXJ22_06530 [Bacteroidales bacterium]|nr:hypothetical protein [Bacteroidales bacterium]